jgi:urease accessory protein
MQATVNSWQGCLDLEFIQRQGATLLSRSQMQAPLKVQRPFYPEGKAVCHTVTLHTAGGIVGGDRLFTQVQLHPQAQVLITNAAATKVYGSNGFEAQQATQIQVATGGCLEWFPQEAIVFDGAQYRQTLRIDLAVDALWLGWDVTRFGRSARGERFSGGEWRSHTEIWQEGQLLWVDPQWLQGGSEMMESPHGLAGYPVVGSFAFVGREVSKELVLTTRSLWEDETRGQGEIGVSRLMAGLVCRYRGKSTTEVRRWLVRVWQLVRQECLGRSTCLPRVWQL